MTRLFEWIIGSGIHDPAWVQSYWTAVLVALSVLTLLVLCRYAWDTYKLANASVEQVKNAQMPFLALVKVERDFPNKTNQLIARLPTTFLAWAVENQGNAAAVNISIHGEILPGAMDEQTVLFESINPIPVRGNILLNVRPAATITSCTIAYSSLDGREFRTEITTVDSKHQLVFRRL